MNDRLMEALKSHILRPKARIFMKRREALLVSCPLMTVTGDRLSEAGGRTGQDPSEYHENRYAPGSCLPPCNREAVSLSSKNGT